MTGDIQTVAARLLREHARPRWKAYLAGPLSLGVLLVGVVVGPEYGLVTPQTFAALQTQSQLYLTEVSGSTGQLLALAIIQGPYLLAIFATVLVAVVGMLLTNDVIARGILAEFAAEGYSTDALLWGVVLATTALSLLSLGALAAVAIGGVGLYLLAAGVTFGVTPSAGLVASLLVPVGLVAWTNLLVTGLAFTHPETNPDDPDGAGALLQTMVVMPAVLIHLVVTVAPQFGIEVFSFLAVAASIVATMATAVKLPEWAPVAEVCTRE